MANDLNNSLMSILFSFGSVALAVLILLVLLVFWIFQFVKLMSKSDEDFPGLYVRALWVAAFLFVPLMAPIAFILWQFSSNKPSKRKSKRKDPKPAKQIKKNPELHRGDGEL